MKYASALEAVSPNVFAQYAHKLRVGDDDFYPLHIGDMLPKPDRAWSLEHHSVTTEDCYAYDATKGWLPFREALAQKVAKKNKIDVDSSQIFPTFGATQGVDMVLSLLLDPEDHLLILAPYWPLVRGMLDVGNFTYTEVPFSSCLEKGQSDMAWANLASSLSSRTKALYLINPNNPNGYVYSQAELKQLLAFAVEHDLWVISDEAYEDFVYEGEHCSLGSLPGAQERTFSIYTMSKSFCIPGYRLGYVVGPQKGIGLMNRVGRGRTYCHSRFITKLGLTALKNEHPFRQSLTSFMEKNREIVGRAFPGVRAPMGGAYYFVPFASQEGALGFLEEALDAGVSVAPGAHFGSDYGSYVRVCFSSESDSRLEKAVSLMKPLYEQWCNR